MNIVGIDITYMQGLRNEILSRRGYNFDVDSNVVMEYDMDKGRFLTDEERQFAREEQEKVFMDLLDRMQAKIDVLSQNQTAMAQNINHLNERIAHLENPIQALPEPPPPPPPIRIIKEGVGIVDPPKSVLDLPINRSDS